MTFVRPFHKTPVGPQALPVEAPPIHREFKKWKYERWEKFLLDTADVIERYGWHRGSMGNRNRGYCVVGAMHEVWLHHLGMNGSERYHRAERELQQYLGVGFLTSWNDHTAPSKQYVLNKLREVANARKVAAERAPQAPGRRFWQRRRY